MIFMKMHSYYSIILFSLYTVFFLLYPVQVSSSSSSSQFELSSYQWIALVFTLLIVGGTYILFYWDDDTPPSAVVIPRSSSGDKKGEKVSHRSSSSSSRSSSSGGSVSFSSSSSKGKDTTITNFVSKADSPHTIHSTSRERIRNSITPERADPYSKDKKSSSAVSPSPSRDLSASTPPKPLGPRILPSPPTLSPAMNGNNTDLLPPTYPLSGNIANNINVSNMLRVASSPHADPSSESTNILHSRKCQDIFMWDEFNDLLGQGQTCSVYRCHIRPEYTKQLLPLLPSNLCVKVYRMDHLQTNVPEEIIEKFIADSKREYDTLSKFNHPQILRVLISYNEFIRRTRNNTGKTERIPSKFFVIMEQAQVMNPGPLWKNMSPSAQKELREYCGPSDLHYYFGTRNRLTEPQVALIMYQILLAVRELHKVNLVHRDLKPANILTFGEKPTRYGTVPVCKLGDFGLAREGVDDSGQTFKTKGRGTPMYMPPEAIVSVNQQQQAAYSTEFDIFSLGTILFNLVTKEFPYDLNEFGRRGMQMIHNGEIHWKITSTINPPLSSGVITLIKKMVNVNGKRRPTVEDVLRDPWFDTVRDEAVNLFG